MLHAKFARFAHCPPVNARFIHYFMGNAIGLFTAPFSESSGSLSKTTQNISFPSGSVTLGTLSSSSNEIVKTLSITPTDGTYAVTCTMPSCTLTCVNTTKSSSHKLWAVVSLVCGTTYTLYEYELGSLATLYTAETTTFTIPAFTKKFNMLDSEYTINYSVKLTGGTATSIGAVITVGANTVTSNEFHIK